MKTHMSLHKNVVSLGLSEIHRVYLLFTNKAGYLHIGISDLYTFCNIFSDQGQFNF